MATFRNPCLTLLHLERAAKRQRWHETSGKSTMYSVDEKVYRRGLNCSDYKGINHQLMSRILGLYPTGVQRKPTVKDNHVPMYERRKRNNWSEFQTGLTATDVIIAWQSHRSSPSQKIVWYMAKDGSHC